jgi:hypothetical protein
VALLCAASTPPPIAALATAPFGVTQTVHSVEFFMLQGPCAAFGSTQDQGTVNCERCAGAVVYRPLLTSETRQLGIEWVNDRAI